MAHADEALSGALVRLSGWAAREGHGPIDPSDGGRSAAKGSRQVVGAVAAGHAEKPCKLLLTVRLTRAPLGLAVAVRRTPRAMLVASNLDAWDRAALGQHGA